MQLFMETLDQFWPNATVHWVWNIDDICITKSQWVQFYTWSYAGWPATGKSQENSKYLELYGNSVEIRPLSGNFFLFVSIHVEINETTIRKPQSTHFFTFFNFCQIFVTLIICGGGAEKTPRVTPLTTLKLYSIVKITLNMHTEYLCVFFSHDHYPPPPH